MPGRLGVKPGATCMQTSLRVQGLLVWPVCGRASSTSLCPPGAHVGSPLVPSPPRHMSRRLGYTSSVSLDVSPSSFPGRGCAPTVDTHRSACTRLSAVALPHLLQGSLLTRSCGPLPGHRAKGVQRGLPEVPPAQLFPSALWPSQCPLLSMTPLPILAPTATLSHNGPCPSTPGSVPAQPDALPGARDPARAATHPLSCCLQDLVPGHEYRSRVRATAFTSEVQACLALSVVPKATSSRPPPRELSIFWMATCPAKMEPAAVEGGNGQLAVLRPTRGNPLYSFT